MGQWPQIWDWSVQGDKGHARSMEQIRGAPHPAFHLPGGVDSVRGLDTQGRLAARGPQLSFLQSGGRGNVHVVARERKSPTSGPAWLGWSIIRMMDGPEPRRRGTRAGSRTGMGCNGAPSSRGSHGAGPLTLWGSRNFPLWPCPRVPLPNPAPRSLTDLPAQGRGGKLISMTARQLERPLGEHQHL